MTASKITVAAACAVAICFLFGGGHNGFAADEYNPRIKSSDFTTDITNSYFNLPVGKKMVFESKKRNGVERTEIQITGETRKVVSVQTLVYWDRVWLNGNLIEETKDYLAQDISGNVWYFGEEVNNYVNGKLANHDGSWLAGVDGAKPGIWFKANPRVGDTYRQEYYRGKAEDMAEVVAVDETVTTTYGTFRNCVKTYDWTPLEPDAKEHKYYCREVGGVALVVNLQTGGRTELIEVSRNTGVSGKTKVLSGKEGNNIGQDGQDDDDKDDKDDKDDQDDQDDR